MEYVNTFKCWLAGLITVLSALWGVTGWMTAAWLVLMAIDWVTGTAAACSAGKWQSSVARQGLWHKAGSMVTVILAGILDLVLRTASEGVGIGFKYTLFAVPLCLTWYILTEAGSILENVGALGAPMPPFLLKAVRMLKAKVESETGEELDNDEK